MEKKGIAKEEKKKVSFCFFSASSPNFVSISLFFLGEVYKNCGLIVSVPNLIFRVFNNYFVLIILILCPLLSALKTSPSCQENDLTSQLMTT